MIDHEKKILFIHIPKCAGTFIEKHLTPNIQWDKTDEKHLTMEHSIDKYGLDIVQSYYKFSIIRNPYERLVSFYLYQKRRNEKLFDSNLCDTLCRKYRTNYYNNFKDFVFNLQHYEHKLAVWVKNDIASCGYFLNNYHGIKMDLVIKQENLSDEISLLEEKFHIAFSNQKTNSSPEKYEYKNFYDRDTIAFVRKFYKDDFHHFYPEADLI
ncbi:MAG: sulfotransferase family 2 domain-containing protein [Pseudomonadota bacterium]